MARLLRAALGGAARLDPALKNRTEGALSRELHRRPRAFPFPDHSLAGLGALLACLALWGVIRVMDAGVATLSGIPGLFVTIPLVANLALMPLAAVVIVQGRRSHEESA